MKETELKFLPISRTDLERKILSQGGQQIFCGEILALYFDTEERVLARQKAVLRLREKRGIFEEDKKEGRCELTWKKKVSDSEAKVMEEKEVQVDDFEKMKEILFSLGFQVLYELNKHRTSYQMGNSHFEIDCFQGFPPWLEVEATSVPALKESCRLLGLDYQKGKTWNEYDVWNYYQERSR